MEEKLIAPCGMNCRLCIAYQFREKDLNRHGFHKKYCPGCIPRGQNCLHMANKCKLLGNGSVSFCYECEAFPCKRLKALDKRYRDKYNMSMIVNLNYIEENGMKMFLRQQEESWRCSECGEILCCHNGLCLSCNLDTLINNRKNR